MQNKRLNFDKIKDAFKKIDRKKAISIFLVFAIIVSSVGLFSSLFDSSSGSSSGGGSSNVVTPGGSGNSNSPSTNAPIVNSYTITFDANGGSGTMENQTVFLSGNTMVRAPLNNNEFEAPGNGWYFTGWNTRPDGSGVSYSNEQYISVKSNMLLYAQWTKDITIKYYKKYNCDWPDFYPPVSNSGPVSLDDSEYYLRVTLDGSVLPGLSDYFSVATEEGNTSPVRSIETKVGSEVYIQLINKGDYQRGAVYVNDEKVAGDSKYCYHSFTVPDASEITMIFTWETEGTTITGNAQSYWICRIYYS